MPVLRTRSRDGSTTMMDPQSSVVRRASSCDQSDCSSMREALLNNNNNYAVEDGEATRATPPSSMSTMKNRSPPSHRQSLSPTATMILDSNSAIKLPSLPIHYQHYNSNHNHNNNNSTIQRFLTSVRHNPDSLYIGIALVAWYLVGVVAICTTKLLLSTPLEDGGVPSPLVLTFQQMSLGSTVFLKTFLRLKGRFTGVGIQAWPVEEGGKCDTTTSSSNSFGFKAPLCWFQQHAVVLDFLLLAGLFNGLDFLASNTCFSHSSASFVETIKASEPITTTGLAIWWGIDRLGKMETLSLTVLITGVLISTYANAVASDTDADATAAEDAPVLSESIKTCLTVMTANLCFAFRAMCQKLLRNTPTGGSQQLDDFNLLFRMQQTGAASLLLPVLLFQHHKLYQVLLGRDSWNVLWYYVGLSLVNAWAFATYSLASCFILSRISVVQHSGFGCLRRLFAIVATSIAFGVPIHALGGIGILMSILGFSGFTHFRFKKEGSHKDDDDSKDNHRHQNDMSNNKNQLKLQSTGTDGTSASLSSTSSGSMGHSSDEGP